MITFLDENDVEYGALATIKATNAVNGERSLTGTIVSGDYVLSNIERGWRLRFDDEYYVVTYAKPVDEGRDVQVEFDAVHQFFWDFDKSSVYEQLTDGSHTFIAYLDFIFKNSGYSYTVDSALNVYAFEKQSFGFKKRLTLFNDIITSTGVEFQVNGKVVRILEKVGTDLSTVVRKNFNMNELTIEKNIGDFVTYQKGFGAYFDEEDHSKGRLEVEYTSPLASVYGKLEAEPFVDERYSQSSSLLAVLKENVDNSYTISVSLDMEDLTRAGYKYKQPVAGDYIMAINETLGFQEKIRIVSFTSEYDVQGNLIKHGVTCNDIGSVKKLSASYTHTQHQAANAEANANTAYEYANKALISADGKNTNYYGDSFPVDNPKGTLKKGDLLFLTVGDTVKQYYWNGADWVINPVLDDVEAFKEQIAEELKDVPNREEFENKISEELATSKAEIETQIETAKTQAESNAKEYADTINQETAKVAELANAAAGEIKADLVNVKNNLTDTSLVANNAQAAVDAAKQELNEVASELNTAKQDLTDSVTAVNTKVDNAKAELTQAKQDLVSHAQQLQTQANAQTELSKRVTTVETTANGTKTTVSELSKTVAQNGKDITSVTARTKVVEDDLTSTKTTLSQVKTTADSASQKTSTLETGLDGVKADLTATTATANTTKTNLANYQASNDRAVANLQSNLQDANGNISSLKTKVEAVPGQITSAVSSVEGKIPTNVSTRNLILKSNDFANPHKQNGDKTTVSSTNDYFVIRSTGYTADAWGGMSWNMSISEVKAGEEFSILMPVYIDSSVNLDNGCAFILKNHSKNSAAYEYRIPTNKKNQWFNVAFTFKAYKDVVFDSYPFYVCLVKNGLVRIKPPMLVRGNLIPSDYQPAFEDTESDISSLSSEIKQTADGITLLATKTELNTAKNELQSGINTATNKTNSNAQTISTHTNQISALNTGLSAKVSQSDFNTLSGRVTTAENNITAKANELSSKITSVEGKIPTSVGARNYIRNYGLTATGWASLRAGWKFEIISDSTAKSGQYLKATCTTASTSGGGFYKKLFDFSDGRLFGKKMTWSMDVKLSKAKSVKIGPEWGRAYLDINATTEWKRYSKTFTVATTTEFKEWIVFTNDNVWNVGDIVYIRDVQLEDGSIATSPAPAIEDTESDITKLSTSLSQTSDGLKQLSTQVTSQGNTITSHTNSINSLNTGLQAKVSQTDFNTLSGRVTTAENNITAKANELSSKITSVESKIPTDIGTVNLVKDTGSAFVMGFGITNTTWDDDKKWAYLDLTDPNVNTAITNEILPQGNKFWDFKPTKGMTYTQSILIDTDATFNPNGKLQNTWFTSQGHNAKEGYFEKLSDTTYRFWSTCTWELEDIALRAFDWWNLHAVLDFRNSGTYLAFCKPKLTAGNLPSDWSPAPEDTAEQISSLSSEFKQTTDAIKASVSSLDNSTVKSSSLTINADGIVMKAGKSTTDVANAIGSYFAVNQNAINLFSDKINVKGNMIVNGAITSDKIASKSINTAHLNGKIITADVIATNAITADAIRAGAVTTDKMSANSINGDRITAGTLDAAKIKAGSITASQIASGTITSNQIKTGGISSANIAAGAITGDKIAAGAIDANKIAANAITANMISGGKLNSTNGATVFDLNAGTLTFNNDYGYIQRVAGDKIFEITTYLGKDADSRDYLTSDFKIRKSDNSRQAGAKFTLYNPTADKPTAQTNINTDTLILSDSKNTPLFAMFAKNSFGNIDTHGWGDIPLADFCGSGLLAGDIAIGGHRKSLKKIVEELCDKAGIWWL